MKYLGGCESYCCEVIVSVNYLLYDSYRFNILLNRLKLVFIVLGIVFNVIVFVID